MNEAMKVKEIKSAVAFLAAGVGLIVLAILNMAQDLTGGVPGSVGKFLTLHKGIGPYSGKQFFSVIAWLLAWAILKSIFVKKDVQASKIMLWAYILIGVAALLVFPPFLDSII